MKTLRCYVKANRNAIVVCLIIMAGFASSYLLFDMPGITVLYPLGLSLAVCMIAGIAGCISFSRRHEAIAGGELPEPDNLIEEDFIRRIDEMRKDMRRAKEQSDEAYRDMIEYYTVWAHQIKTPIAAMRLQLQQEDSETARRLEGDLNRIEGYVDMAMAYLRLDSESTDYLIRDYSLDEILRRSIRRFSREFILKKLSLDYVPVEITVLTDEKWLSFVIEQIISNGIKYTEEGGTIRIYAKGKDCLCIEDTGTGINPEDLPRVFEKGYTGFNGRINRNASGLGLHLCKRILESLGHGISISSTPGEGTTVTLNLRRGSLEVE